MNLFKRIDPVDRAYKRLKGYCAKQIICSGCRFSRDDGCVLDGVVPADWPTERDGTEDQL